MTGPRSARFPCESGAHIHFDWGQGGVIELCSLGSNSQAFKQDWWVLCMLRSQPCILATVPMGSLAVTLYLGKRINPNFRRESQCKVLHRLSPGLPLAFERTGSKPLRANSFGLLSIAWPGSSLAVSFLKFYMAMPCRSSLDFSARRVAYATAPLFRKLQSEKQKGMHAAVQTRICVIQLSMQTSTK